MMKYVGRFSSIVIIVLVLTLIGAGLACPKAAPESTTIKIGALAELTGAMAEDGIDCVRGAELRLDEAGGEVAGRKIEFIVEDYGADPANVGDKLKKLLEHDKVDVVLGPLFNPAAVAAADYLTESKTPHILWVVKDRQVVEFGGGNTFLPQGTPESNGYRMGLYASEVLGYRTATAIFPDYSSGEQFGGSMSRGFEAKGGTIIQLQRVPLDAMDFAPFLSSMEQADCCFWWNRGPFVAAFLKQYDSYGLTMPLVFAMIAPAHEKALAAADSAASVGMVGAGPYTPLIDTDISKHFADAYYNKYGDQSRGESETGYVAMSLYLEAVKATGGDTSHDKINEALHNLKIDTPAGPVAFTSEGVGIGDIYITKVIKIGDRYCWEPIHKYSQIVLEEP
jgi:branched-chain amino acid transport system substrate-binding protein